MFKLNAKELARVLENKEVSFIELDNFMVQNGYCTVFNDGVTEDVKDVLSIVYMGADTYECEIKMDFEITIDNGEDEANEAFYLKIKSVKEF